MNSTNNYFSKHSILSILAFSFTLNLRSSPIFENYFLFYLNISNTSAHHFRYFYLSKNRLNFSSCLFEHTLKNWRKIFQIREKIIMEHYKRMFILWISRENCTLKIYKCVTIEISTWMNHDFLVLWSAVDKPYHVKFKIMFK